MNVMDTVAERAKAQALLSGLTGRAIIYRDELSGVLDEAMQILPGPSDGESPDQWRDRLRAEIVTGMALVCGLPAKVENRPEEYPK